MPADNVLPAKLSHRHHLLAYLLVGGKKDVEAAEAIGYSVARVQQIKRSPLFVALCNELRAEIAEKHVTNVAQWLEQETGPTLRRLKDLRDQDESLPVALGATTAILDRAAPKVSKHETEQIHRHVWDRRDVEAMGKVFAELQGTSPDVVEAEFRALDEQPALPESTDEAHDVGVPTLDELLDEYEGEER